MVYEFCEYIESDSWLQNFELYACYRELVRDG